MSVILKEHETGKIILICKGADSILLERTDMQKSLKIHETKINLDNYGTIGLRTLLLCKKEIPANIYENWAKEYNIASTTLDNRDEKMGICQD